MKKPLVLSFPLSAQRRLLSDWADAQADLSLRWAQSLCWFCHVAAHVFLILRNCKSSHLPISPYLVTKLHGCNMAPTVSSSNAVNYFGCCFLATGQNTRFWISTNQQIYQRRITRISFKDNRDGEMNNSNVPLEF